MNKIPTAISSDRLILKPFDIKNFDDFYLAFENSFDALNQYYSPAWSQYKTLPDRAEMRIFYEQKIIEFQNHESFFFLIFEKNTGHFIGQRQIHSFDSSVPKGRLGCWIDSNQTRKGYAFESANMITQFGFDILNCKRLEIRNDTRNIASGKTAQKLGYKFLTIFEKNKQGKKGDFWNLEIYARLDKTNLPNLEITYHYD